MCVCLIEFLGKKRLVKYSDHCHTCLTKAIRQLSHADDRSQRFVTLGNSLYATWATINEIHGAPAMFSMVHCRKT